MAHTKVLLREDVDDLGARGEIVRVRAGYARNYLLPRNLAVQATAGNVKGIEQERAALLKKEAKERAHSRGAVATDGLTRARVQAQSRRAGRVVRLGHVDGRGGGAEGAWLRDSIAIAFTCASR
jgi:ribosomal protein L9